MVELGEPGVGVCGWGDAESEWDGETRRDFGKFNDKNDLLVIGELVFLLCIEPLLIGIGIDAVENGVILLSSSYVGANSFWSSS